MKIIDIGLLIDLINYMFSIIIKFQETMDFFLTQLSFQVAKKLPLYYGPIAFQFGVFKFNLCAQMGKRLINV